MHTIQIQSVFINRTARFVVFLFFILSLSSITKASAQNFWQQKKNAVEVWVARYNGPGNDFATDLAVDEAGNVYVTGSARSDIIGDYVTIKYNSSGIEQWVSRYNGTGNGDDWASALVIDGKGNVYVTGTSRGLNTSDDFATIKYNSSGLAEWAVRYNGQGNLTDKPSGLAVDRDGNVYVTGFSQGGVGVFDYVTIKYNSSGQTTWVARYNGTGNNFDSPSALTIDDVGNVYVTGESYGVNTSKDFATIKYNSFGIEQWVARYNGPENSADEAQAIVVEENGNVYVTGGSGGPSREYTTIKYNSSGDEQWVTQYNGPGDGNDEPSDIAIDAKGNIYVTGESLGLGTRYDFATVKYNNSGAEQWVARYNGPGNADDLAVALSVDESQNIYITGTSSATGTLGVSGGDYTTIKYDSSGVVKWTIRYNGLGNEEDHANALSLDKSGNVYVTGYSRTLSTSLDFATLKYFDNTVYPLALSLSSTVNFSSRPNASDYKTTDYRLVGLPGAINRSVKEFLSGQQNKDWQAYRDNGAASNFFEVFDGSSNFQFSVGRAFWIISKKPFSVNTTTPSAPLNADQEIEVPLQSGWNLITNPFTASVLWSKIQTANNVTEPIWTFNGSFSQADTFKTYAGYYFFNATNLTLLKIPYALYFSGNSAEVVSKNWRVGISLIAGQFNEQAVSFGVANEASHGLDVFDFRKPRALAATPTVEFKRPTWDASYSTFASDIRPEFEDAENWEFDVRAISRQPAQLAFSGISKIPSRFEVYLIDAGHAQSVNLREDSLYRFTPSAELMKFKVVVGRKENVQEQLSALALPKDFALGPNYPNPFSPPERGFAGNPTTTIPVAVPAATEIKLKLYNLLGAEVKTIYEGTIEAGRYWFNWDGRNELGNQVATGVYLYRLTTSKGISLLGKMILMR